MSSASADKQPTHFKLLLMGDGAVGKSSLQLRYTDDTFTETYTSSTGLDFRIREVELDGKPIELYICDTPNPDRLITLTNAYYRNTQGIMLIYNVTDQESFNSIQYLLQEVESQTPEDVPKILVGNQCDETTKRVVDYTTGQEYAAELGIPFVETSAKDSTNVEQAFTMLAAAAKTIMDSKRTQKELKRTDTKPDDSPCCCLI